MKVVSTLLFLLMLSLGLQAQGKKSLVSVPVAVSDREGRYISGLKKDDFSIFQDGKEQKIELFATEDEPVSVAILLDTSESTKGVLDKIRLAAKDFIELLNNKDQCLVATFDSEVKILSPFTSDRDALEKSLDKIQTGEREGTVVFSAVEQVARENFVKIPGRKIIILLSDGKDFKSSISKSTLFSQLEESDVMIYSIFYQTGRVFVDSNGAVKEPVETKKPEIKEPETKKPPKKKKKRYSIKIALPRETNTAEEITQIDTVTSAEAVNVLQEMSATTAGRFYMSDAPKLSQIFKKIASEVRQQYRLGFYPKDAVNDALANDIIVKVNRPDAVVRARGKYRAKQL